MKLKFKETVQDKYTNQYYYKNTVYDFAEERAKEILSVKNGYYAEEVEEELKAETPQHTDDSSLKATPELEAVKLEDLTVAELRVAAKDLGLSTRGNKAELIKHIKEVN